MTGACRTASVGIVSLGAIAIFHPGCGLPVGGSELQCWLLARRLARESGIRVTLYVGSMGQSIATAESVEIRPLVPVGRDLRLTWSRAFRALAILARSGHDVFVTRSASGINGVVWMASRLSGARHVHMCAHDRECAGEVDSTLSPLARRLHGLAMRRADLLLCQTESQRKRLSERLGREAVVSPNLLPPLPTPPSEARSGVLWVGRDVEWKRPELFIEIARSVPEERCTMVCQPQPGRDMSRLIRASPPNLSVLPGLSFEETSRLFAAHRVFVCTSTEEGFPNVILQAAQVGTPVVTLGVDPDGLISQHEGGIVCGDVGHAVRAIHCLLTDAQTWQKYSRGASEMAQSVGRRADEAVTLILALARGDRDGKETR